MTRPLRLMVLAGAAAATLPALAWRQPDTAPAKNPPPVDVQEQARQKRSTPPAPPDGKASEKGAPVEPPGGPAAESGPAVGGDAGAPADAGFGVLVGGSGRQGIKVVRVGGPVPDAESRRVWVGQQVVVDRWRPLELTEPVTGLFEFRTGADATVEVTLDDRTRLRIGRLSRVRVSRASDGHGGFAPLIEFFRGRIVVDPGASAGQPGPLPRVSSQDQFTEVVSAKEFTIDAAGGTRAGPVQPAGR